MEQPQQNGPEKITYRGKIIEVVEQPMLIGQTSVVFEFARRAPGTRLIIKTPDAKILLSREYRSEVKGFDYRLPGGKVFDALSEYNEFQQSGGDITEKTKTAALKEAREEVGVIAQGTELFGISKCGATVEWDLYYFVIENFTQQQQALEEGEVIEILPTPFEEARAMCFDGRIKEERSALMLLRYLKN